MTTEQINHVTPAFHAQDIDRFRKRLFRWYGRHGRKELPWRDTKDAYAIYVSEIMLQQTQVATVRDRYYTPFLQRFPTLESLADAPRKDVLKAWQGLGYYNRAVNLHEAAGKSGKSLPETVDALMALPGIGRNTAHAIAAFAYRQPVAVMEANVKRVLARIFALASPADAELWEKAALLLDVKNPFDYNQAMMDLGALVCTRRAPVCGHCPASGICRGKDAPASYPAAKKKKAVPVRKKRIFVLHNAKGQYFAEPRKGKFLNGLYHFHEADKKPFPKRARKLGAIRQQYSHFTLEAEIYLAKTNGGGKYWHEAGQLHRLPFSMAEQKILKLLETA